MVTNSLLLPRVCNGQLTDPDAGRVASHPASDAEEGNVPAELPSRAEGFKRSAGLIPVVLAVLDPGVVCSKKDSC